MRRTFYLTLTVVFPLFFLLHWNGLFDRTYYWALLAVGGTRSVLLQAAFALISSVAIFAVMAGLFELAVRTWARTHGRQVEGLG